MGMKEYVLWGGGLLVVLVVAHGLWQAWRSRRRRDVARAEIEPEVDSGDTEQMDIFEPPVLNDVDDDADWRGSVDAGSSSEDAAPAGAEEAEESVAVVEDATNATDDVAEPSAGEREGLAPRRQEPSAGEPDGLSPGEDETYIVEPEGDTDGGKRGRRVVIPGKRTEPTVPRNDHLFKVRTSAPEPSRAPPAPPGLDQVVVIWVAAKDGTSFGGHELVKALADNGLRYGNDALFRKFDVDSGEELFSVVNGLEPGTFDLSDLDALSTPRIVMLLSLVNATTGLAAFSEMLDAAQDISISLGGELRDENMGPMTGQTIEHYRQRISDYKRKSLRK
ncbi:MAG: cell division protein ZipA C-terminal FtsZ-binding domain-containing protein [Gammaproteobacteria bacterium]|nr:cell division protein ZipA C-terminal FtsZ-binding domain-containing protein [Gammaproteobacteria bacterium]